MFERHGFSSGVGILGIGAYRPRRVVDNAEVASRTGRTADWIERRTGIIERRYAEPTESVADMAVEAARKAAADAGVAPEQLSTVIVSSMSNVRHSPAAAPDVAHRIGSAGAAFDINAGCAGFCHGLAMARAMVRDGTAEYVMVIGSDKMTDIIDWHDPSTGLIFADGAGAAVVGRRDTCDIGPVIWGSDGSGCNLIGHSATWTEYRDDPTKTWPTMQMAGREVFRWAIETMPDVVARAVQAAGLALNDLDAVVLHQANVRIIDAITERLELPDHVAVARDLVTAGNTSAASIPLAIAQLRESGAVGSGALALLLGFGAGLSWAAQVVRLP